ncbi:cysteine dioxygenase [Bordetella bronchiseptica]|uniref:cysteine dioxygenase family protein n=1 Tax=Bordetella bronchiseptica TaxID=518 RepID=UPI000461E7C5|nr:cysteine dioxygenase [Bordetella bronchiseptica]KDD39886.1 cysteine dioxygenase type I domain protein [Bordetella bronchiseptica MBORD901]
MSERLLNTVVALGQLVERTGLLEAAILAQARQLIAGLVAHDDWLPDEMAQPHPEYYRQYLLYGDPRDRYSLVSFVWGPGQKTPVHDHTVWGVIGMLRGAETDQPFRRAADGRLAPEGPGKVLRPGDVACVSPSIGDIHQVSNAYDDRVSISIHLYGGNIGRIRRSVYDPQTGASKAFVSGYSNAMTPNLWAAPNAG